MNRYSSYGPKDEQPRVNGDNSLVGTNDWDAAENLQPGQCQSAVNMDFTTQDAVTRGGFVCLPALATTPFGQEWTTYAMPGAVLQLTSVCYGNGRFVGVGPGFGTTALVAWSLDGRSWTAATSTFDGTWNSVCYGNGLFAAVSSGHTAPANDYIMTSPDGVTWTTVVQSTNELYQVAYGNGRFVAMVASQSANYYSTDGVTWTYNASAGISSSTFPKLKYGNGIFVSVSTQAPASTSVSTDGITWTNSTQISSLDTFTLLPQSTPNAFCYGNGIFAVAGSNGICTSTDGLTWTFYSQSGWGGTINTLAYGNGIFIALGYNSPNTLYYTSTDAMIWNLRTGGPTSSGGFFDAAYGADVFVAVRDVISTTAWSDTLVYASGTYSDPNNIGQDWVMLVGNTTVGFYANGKTPHTVSLGSYRVTEQSTIVQCNNLVYLFRGADSVPLYWSGNWADEFIIVPTSTPAPGFTIIPNSNQATYYQDRLWVVDGKDQVAASDVLDFNTYDAIANNFNLNQGSSDYIVTTYPFGDNSLIVFKQRSILILQNVQGSLADITVTEVTRQVGCIGINAVTTVGPDIAYMSDRNINLITLTATNNSVQHKTLPLSRNISGILKRVNWEQAYKVSMTYFDNKLFVAVPLDNSLGCNTLLVYNFVTENWFGEWTFEGTLNLNIQGLAIATYLGLQRLHAITDDGRIFVFDSGQNDISGTTVADISTSVVTRAYNFDGNNATQSRLWVDLGTNRPNFSITSFTDGASESSEILTDQTYARTESWIFNDSTYDVTNANNDFNRAYRKDYSSGPLAAGSTQGLPTTGLQCGTGFLPEQVQSYRVPLITRRQGRLSWLEVTNTTGFIQIKGLGFENHAGQRSSLIQV